MDRAEDAAKARRGGTLRWAGVLSRWLWPPSDERPGLPASTGLGFITEPYCRTCARPVEYDIGAETRCAPCTARPPVWARARAALRYDDASRGEILALKHAGKREKLDAMGRWMGAAGRELLETADYLVPVPLHPFRLAKRGFNQSVWLAAAVSRQTGVPLLHSALRRKRPTPTQGGLSARARSKNVAGAFAVRRGSIDKVKGRRLVLVDDVYTTGATLRSCARVLKKAGAANVDVLVLARVVRDQGDTI